MFFKVAYPMLDAVSEGGGGGAVDLGDVISQSIAGLSDDAPVNDSIEAPPESKAQTPPPPDDPEEAELTKLSQEILAKNPAMKGQRINIDRHQAVLTRTRNQHEKALKDWADKQAAWSKAEEKYKADLEKWKEYEFVQDPDFKYALQALDLSERDQKKFAELLLQDPRYAEILQFKEAQEAKAAPVNRPGPNQRSADGKMEYYDDDGIQALLDWHGGNVKKSAIEEARKEFQKELNAFKEEYGPLKENFELQTAWHQAKTTQAGILNNARESWPGFKENEGKCKEYMIANPKSDLAEAYREVVVKGMVKADTEKEAAWRAKFQQEMTAKKAAAGGNLKPAAGTGVEKVSGNKDEAEDMTDVIKAAIRNLPR